MGTVLKVFKVLLIISFILAVILSIFGLFLVNDALDFKKNLPTKPNLFLLVDGSKVLAGLKDVMHETEPVAITEQERAQYQKYLDANDFIGLQGNNYRIFLVHTSMFDSIPEGTLINTTFVKSEIINVLKRDSAREWFMNMTLNTALAGFNATEEEKETFRQEVDKRVPPEQDIRKMFFALLLAAANQDKGASVILDEYRIGNIEIDPQTVLFSFIDALPQSFIDKVKASMDKQAVVQG